MYLHLQIGSEVIINPLIFYIINGFILICVLYLSFFTLKNNWNDHIIYSMKIKARERSQPIRKKVSKNTDSNPNPNEPNDWWSKLKKWIKENPIKTATIAVAGIATICSVVYYIMPGTPPPIPPFYPVTYYDVSEGLRNKNMIQSHHMLVSIAIMLKASQLNASDIVFPLSERIYRMPLTLDSPFNHLFMLKNIHLSYRQEIILIALICNYLNVDILSLQDWLTFYLWETKLELVAVTDGLRASDIIHELNIRYWIFMSGDQHAQFITMLVRLCHYWDCEFSDLPNKILNVIHVINNIPNQIQWIAVKCSCPISEVPEYIEAFIEEARLHKLHMYPEHTPNYPGINMEKVTNAIHPDDVLRHNFLHHWAVQFDTGLGLYVWDKRQIIDCITYLARYFQCPFAEVPIKVQELLDSGVWDFKNNMDIYVPMNEHKHIEHLEDLKLQGQCFNNLFWIQGYEDPETKKWVLGYWARCYIPKPWRGAYEGLDIPEHHCFLELIN